MLSHRSSDALVLPEPSLDALHDAQRALLCRPTPAHPLARSVEAAQAALERLFRTPHAALLLSHPSRSPRAPNAFEACVQALPPGTLPSCEEAVFSGDGVPTGAATHFREAGYRHVLGACATAPQGWAGVFVAFSDADAPLLGTPGHHLMGVLLPALRSFAQHRADPPAPLALFERLGEPLAIYDAAGAPLCTSRAFTRLLRGDDEGARVCREAASLALALHASTDAPVAARPASLARTVRTGRSRYELHASPIPRVVLGVQAVLIHLRGYRVRMPSPARLRTRLGLTQREAEVALLVAEGLTSKEIAARLDLSAHTVRRHGERVLEKLGLHARAGVGLAIMRLG